MTKEERLTKALLLIQNLTNSEDAYKVDVDTAKGLLSRAFDGYKRALGEEFTHAGKWESLSEEEIQINRQKPLELRHYYGKKWGKVMEKAPDTPYIQAIRAMMETFDQPYQDLQALVKRQVKGRKPDTREREVIGTGTQMRAQCACCFREQAVKGDRMVAHGYDLRWGFQNGTCRGASQPHFGTPEGRDLCAKWAVELHQKKDGALDAAERVMAGEIPVRKQVRRNGEYVSEIVENPLPYQIEAYADGFRREARQYEAGAEAYEKAVREWKPVAAREVVIEKTRVKQDTPAPRM